MLRNPKSYEPARGGSFVYISVPAALGTDEAHAMTVALRGAPPSFSPGDKRIASRHQEEFFTLYIKDLGPWTGALRSVANGAEVSDDPKSLLVDVDGFYTHVTSFNTMMVGGAGRIVVVAGGSGATSLMGFIQVNQIISCLSLPPLRPSRRFANCLHALLCRKNILETIRSRLGKQEGTAD